MIICPKCGASLDDKTLFCSSCGTKIAEGNTNTNNQQYQQPYGNNQGYNNGYNTYMQEAPYSGMAIAGFVMSLLGFFIPFICSLLAIIFGGVAMGACNRNERRGRGLAIAGIVIGIIMLIIWVIFIIFAMALGTGYWFYLARMFG